jgi:hypothetical protein
MSSTKTVLLVALMGATLFFLLKRKNSGQRSSLRDVATVDYGAQGASDSGMAQTQGPVDPGFSQGFLSGPKFTTSV